MGNNYDGQVRIIIDTNADQAAKALDNTSKAFDKTGNSAEKVTSVFNSLQNGVNNNIDALREMALGGGQNSKEFQRLAQQTREYKKSLEDANKAVNSAIGEGNELNNTVRNLIGGFIGLQSIRTVTQYVMSSVEAFREEDIAIKALNQSLANAGVYSQAYSKEIQELANQIQKTTNYGNEAVIRAQALGQAYAGNVRITKELTLATVDFAAATGMDLEQAFTLVGKSIGSSTNALGRYGIELKQGMTEQEKATAIANQLGLAFAGQAQNMSNASIQLANSLQEVAKAVGRVFNPAIEEGQNKLAKFADVATKTIEIIGKVQRKFFEFKRDTNLRHVAVGNMYGWDASKFQAEADKYQKYIDTLNKKNTPVTTGKTFKLNDDYGAIGVSGGSNVVSINQAKSKQEAIKAETAKIIEQKGAYQQLQDKITDLTAKLRDLAAEQQVGSADWVQYKQDLSAAQIELENVNKSLEDNGIKIDDVSKRISSSLSSGLISALRGGGSAFEIFSNIAVNALQKVLDKMLEMAVIKPLLNSFGGGFGGLFSLFGFKDGGVFKNGNVIPFAKGGLVNKPTLFPMANGGTGLMGEAGTEAVMPLKRMANGKLGVEASGNNGTVINIYNQSNSQIETRKRDDGSMDIIIKRVNEALKNERTSSGFRAAYQREDRKGVQAC